MISDDLKNLLDQQSFLIIATSSKDGMPNAAPMFLVKVDEKYIYLTDYTMGTTWRNLKENPRISTSISDKKSLYRFSYSDITFDIFFSS